MNLQSLRDAVRSQLDLDDEDLPNTLLDLFIREGFERSIQREQQWPFYATEWAVSTVGGSEASFPLPSDLSGLVAVTDPDGRAISHLTHALASDSFADATHTAAWGIRGYFSIWGKRVYVWPKPTETATYGLRGWRRPTDWVSLGAAAEVDADVRLHLPIIHYACSRSYAQQEDEILERTYLDSWDRGVEHARTDIMRPDHRDHVIVLNAGFRVGHGRQTTLVP